jgi:hypothetical protein
LVAPPRWTEGEFAAERAISREAFRVERLSAPLEEWVRVVEQKVREFGALFESHGFANFGSAKPAELAAIYADHLGDAIRYVAGPPISSDDLKLLAEVESLAPTRLQAQGGAEAAKVLEVLQLGLDPTRFPWIPEHRQPTPEEEQRAIFASASLRAYQEALSSRRNDAKKAQEDAVKEHLRSIGLKEAKRRRILTLDDAPPRGHFYSETHVGTKKADIPVRLYDGRLMPIECKVSNSEVNSFKRINEGAQSKAETWHREFGTSQVVPTAVIQGAFKVSNLLTAQAAGLTIIWFHRLADLTNFIERTKS